MRNAINITRDVATNLKDDMIDQVTGTDNIFGGGLMATRTSVNDE